MIRKRGQSTIRAAAPLSREPPFSWPDDYIGLDWGKMAVRPDYLEAFHRLGWKTLRAVMKSRRAKVFRQIGERDNARVHFGAGLAIGYLKRHWSRSLGIWLRECRTSGASGPPAWQEIEGIKLCREAGIATPSLIAAGWQFRGGSWQSDSFVVTEAVDGLAADEFARGQDLDAARRHALLTALGRTVRQLHQAGLVHRDLYWCHLFVREDPREEFAVTLIDLQRVFRPRRWVWRWKLKDLAQFAYSMPETLQDGASLKSWYRAYLDKPRLGLRDRLALTAVWLRAGLYRLREGPP